MTGCSANGSMIAVSSSGKSFRAIAWYLAAGRTGKEHDRVAWTTARNLPTSDPELAARFMRATAAQSDRTEKPVYHIALSFDPSDPVDRPTMERVADHLLQALGLAEHQAVIVAHRDRDHPHLHLLINRVHPDTGKAWERWKDRPAIQQFLRAEEQALGLRQVPGTLARSPTREAPEKPPPEPQASRPAPAPPPPRELPTAEPAHLPGTLSLPSPPDRVPAPVPDRPREPAEQLARDIRAYERASELARRGYHTGLSAETARVREAELEAARGRAARSRDALLAALRPVFREPESALRAYLDLAETRGSGTAIDALRQRPQVFGAIRTVEERRVLGLVRSPSDEPARRAARAAANPAQVAAEAQEHLRRTVGRIRANRLDDGLRREFRALYQDPDGARARLEQAILERGLSTATDDLRRAPAGYGPLTEAMIQTPARAQALAERAASLAREAAIQRGPSPAETQRLPTDPTVEHRRAREALATITRRARSLQHELGEMPGARELEHRIRQGLRALTPPDLNRLRLLVTAPQLLLVQRLRRTVRDVALGREEPPA